MGGASIFAVWEQGGGRAKDIGGKTGHYVLGASIATWGPVGQLVEGAGLRARGSCPCGLPPPASAAHVCGVFETSVVKVHACALRNERKLQKIITDSERILAKEGLIPLPLSRLLRVFCKESPWIIVSTFCHHRAKRIWNGRKFA